jgi:hypothetical protein
MSQHDLNLGFALVMLVFIPYAYISDKLVKLMGFAGIIIMGILGIFAIMVILILLKAAGLFA